jgi:pyruvate,water dikinase
MCARPSVQSPSPSSPAAGPWVVALEQVGLEAIAQVGGKNASLGELQQQLAHAGVRVPAGFAITTDAYRLLLACNGLPEPLHQLLDSLDTDNLAALRQAGATARRWLLEAAVPPELEGAILAAYRHLGSPTVAVRSSATAEDLAEASFAGQQETVLHVQGEAELLAACRRCWSSLFTDRALAYRQEHGFRPMEVALSIGVQRMVLSDRACAGVMFSIDTESGFANAVLLTGSYGLGEAVVQGTVNPDEWLVFKPTLEQGYAPILHRRLGSKAIRLVRGEHGEGLATEVVPPAEQRRFCLEDGEVLALARWACAIEAHYSQRRGQATPMDIEWAKDGPSGDLFILQARPETVQSRRAGAVLRSWRLDPHTEVPILSGQAIGASVSSGVVRILQSPQEIERFQPGDLLVTVRTDPDWEPILRRASGVVTDQGGRTCHAAIIARELGITAIVGTLEGSRRLQEGSTVTLSCCEGEVGQVYPGRLSFQVEEQELTDLPATRTAILMNVGNPEEAFQLAALPCDGVGLARLEFIIANHIRVHPLALLEPQRVASEAERLQIAALCQDYADPASYYVDQLAQGMARIAAAFHPRPVILRFSDFKSHEYARLLGGAAFEPKEENPMLGWRGACRYTSPGFAAAFALECQALVQVRRTMGLTNVIPMVPFCRTPEEGDRVLAAMAGQGLVRGQDGLEVYVMCELPSNVMAADAFAARFDGFSIGSNDLTQLTLGLDRDSALVAHLFDERHPSVLAMVGLAIQSAKRCGRRIGLCGQAPSDHPEFLRFLVEQGIDSISLNPDSVLSARLRVAEVEAELPVPAGPRG